jgi:hypothetical protein
MIGCETSQPSRRSQPCAKVADDGMGLKVLRLFGLCATMAAVQEAVSCEGGRAVYSNTSWAREWIFVRTHDCRGLAVRPTAARTSSTTKGNDMARPVRMIASAAIVLVFATGIEQRPAFAQTPPTSGGPVDPALIEDLVAANRILAQQGVLDESGHVSIRHPANPNRYLMARSLSPALVTAEDVMEFDQEFRPAPGSFGKVRRSGNSV